jgi:protoporphyrinogen oxidase
MKIAVIGAGPAGLTAAYLLSKELGTKLTQLDVYESEDAVGGMCKSISLWNQTVDLGPHRFFSKDKKINKLWLELAGSDYEMVSRTTRIFYKQKFFDYPIRVFNALNGLGLLEALHCLFSYLKQKIAPVKDTSTFEGWVTRKFGKRLYTIFFKTYSEKLWGISCKELDSDFAAQRIKKLSLFEAIRNALISRKKHKHATLVEQFAYPYGGTGSIYKKMQDKITQGGGIIHLNSQVKRVITDQHKADGVELSNGTIIKYDQIISTMPLTNLLNSMDDSPASVRENAADLRFRNNVLVFLQIDNSSLFKDQWLYIHDSELETGRITNFRNWTPQLFGNEKQSILCMEYWCNFDDDLWNDDDEDIISMASREIAKIGLAQKSEILKSSVYRIPNCYPVYFKNYKEKLEPIQQFLSGIRSLHIIGRYGAYKYNNQDHSILMGMLAAENILSNACHNLWEINTDYEDYQESSPVTKTGLAADVNK